MKRPHTLVTLAGVGLLALGGGVAAFSRGQFTPPETVRVASMPAAPTSRLTVDRSATPQRRAASRPQFLEPQLVAAQLVKQEIDGAEEKFERTAESLAEAAQQAVERLETGTILDDKLAADAVAELARELKESARHLVARFDEYKENTEKLQAALVRGPPAYRTAAKACESYAAEESYADLKQQYVDLGAFWLSLADTMEQRERAFAPEANDVQNFLAYVKRVEVYLERLETHLRLFPEVPTDRQRQAYLDRLRSFMAGFRELQQLLKSFRSQLDQRGDAAQPAGTEPVLPRTESDPAQQTAMLTRTERPVAVAGSRPVTTDFDSSAWQGRSERAHAEHGEPPTGLAVQPAAVAEEERAADPYIGRATVGW